MVTEVLEPSSTRCKRSRNVRIAGIESEPKALDPRVIDYQEYDERILGVTRNGDAQKSST